MAENTVVKEQLTDAMIKAGAELTRKLDEGENPPTAALWFFDPEINEWRLLFAAPDVASLGRVNVYRRIRHALEQLGDKASAIPFSMISLLDSYAELLQVLRSTVRADNVHPPAPQCARLADGVEQAVVCVERELVKDAAPAFARLGVGIAGERIDGASVLERQDMRRNSLLRIQHAAFGLAIAFVAQPRPMRAIHPEQLRLEFVAA